MVIDNLISNAIKYSYKRTSVTVSISRREDMLAVSVTDRGVGVAAEDRSQLFKKFNRIQNPLSRSEAGSGLGLFLAYQLARAHGGDIEVRTAPDKGSTFTLLMPTRQIVKEALVSIVD
jgi:two-component system sensor histidine kinase SenX3